jgi:hypothetical protein
MAYRICDYEDQAGDLVLAALEKGGEVLLERVEQDLTEAYGALKEARRLGRLNPALRRWIEYGLGVAKRRIEGVP